jgi:hypothetical protein
MLLRRSLVQKGRRGGTGSYAARRPPPVARTRPLAVVHLRQRRCTPYDLGHINVNVLKNFD